MGSGRAGSTVYGGPIDPVLTEILAGWPDERLAALLAARPELTAPAPTSFEALAGMAGLPGAVRVCLRRLDCFAQQLAEAVCLLDELATVEALVAVLGEPADEPSVRAGLGRLEELALVVPVGKRLHAVGGLRSMPNPGGLGPPAASLLGKPGTGDMAAIAKRLGVEPGRTKAVTSAAVVAALGDPAVVRRVVEAGPKGTLELVSRLVHEPVLSVSSTFYTPEHTPIGWLVLRGLLVAASWDTLVVPREVGLALRGGRAFQPLPTRPQLRTAAVDQAAVDQAASQTALKLVADVATVVDGLSDVPVRILKAGGVGIRDIRRLAKLLARPEAETARVVDLASIAGLAVADPATEQALPTPAYDRWLETDVADRWVLLVERWLGSDLHLSLAGAIDGKDKPIPPLLYRGGEPDAEGRRRLVLGALLDAAPGRRPEPVDVTARAAWDGPRLWLDGPASPTTLLGWVTSEAELLGVSSGGTLGTAGRSAIAGRMGEARAALAERAPAVVSNFVIQADFSAMAAGPLARAVLSELELLADIESTGAATVFRFSEGSLIRAMAAGRDAEAILSFLEAHATKGVPQPLAYLIGDLGRRYGRVRVGSARCYVRSDDPALLAEAVRGRRTMRLGLRLLAPTVAVADAEPMAVVVALREAGFLAADEDAEGGLVLHHRQPRRAAPVSGPWRMPLLPPGPDPAEVVAALRRPPAPAPRRAPAPPPAPPPLRLLPPGPWGLEDDYEDEVPRPTTIAHGPAAAKLLALASGEEWLVRLAHTNGRNQVVEKTVLVAEVDDEVAYVERLPRWTAETVVLDRVKWARVLTEAEEEGVL